MRKVLVTTIVLLSTAVWISGCGGDNRSPGNSEVVRVPQVATLNRDTMRAAAASALGGAAAQWPLAVDGAAVAARRVPFDLPSLNLFAFFVRHAEMALRPLVFPPAGMAALEQLAACDGGTVRLQAFDDDRDGRPGQGDSVVMVFDRCAFRDDQTLSSGRLTVSIERFGALSPVSDFRVLLEFDRLRVDTLTGSALLDGRVRLTEFLADGEHESRFEFDTFAVETAGAVVVVMQDFQTTRSESPAGGVVQIHGTGALFHGRVGGVINVVTSRPLMRSLADAYPFSGEIVISAESATLIVSVLDGVLVRLALDEDGDGAVDIQQDVTWTDLLWKR